jgi:hypothetical protein
MPTYTYHCETNGKTVEVSHPADVTVSSWGELCYVAQVPFGSTPPASPVRRLIKSAPAVAVEDFNSELRNAGFTKLVRRDEGVYENVTALDDESRFMKRGDPSTIPKVHKKVGD